MQIVMTDEERDEIVKLILERMEETTGNMLTTLKLKVQAEHIEGLTEKVEELVKEIIESASVDIDITASGSISI